MAAVLAHSGSPASSHWAHGPAWTKPPKAAACQAPAGAAFYCYNHKQVLDRADLKHTCHKKGEPRPPNTWLHESSCTLFKAYLLTQVSPCLFFVVVLPLPSTFQQVPGSQLLLLALLQGWAEMGKSCWLPATTASRAWCSQWAPAPNPGGICQLGFLPHTGDMCECLLGISSRTFGLQEHCSPLSPMAGWAQGQALGCIVPERGRSSLDRQPVCTGEAVRRSCLSECLDRQLGAR